MSSHSARRCFRGVNCPLREPILTTGDPATAYQAPLLSHPDEVFCPACRGQLQAALAELPQLLPSLEFGRMPTFEVRYRDLDICSPRAPFQPVPLNLEADAVIRFVDHETDTWAEMLSDFCGLRWDSALSRSQTVADRIADACRTLGYGMNRWLAMGPQTYRARSLGLSRASGHDPERLTYDGHDLWTTRTGAESAAIILGLRDYAGRVAGPPPSDRLQEPCWAPACGSRSVYRLHYLQRVQCRTCGATKSDNAFEEYQGTFLRAALATTGAA